jgi:hypothetical protein
VGQPDGVVAGIEHEQRHVAVVTHEPAQVADLGDRGVGGVGAHREATGVDRRGPRVGRPVELADPLIRPAGHDRLARRVLRRVVVEAALGTGFGVATVPGRRVHGEHRRPAVGPMIDQQLAERLCVDTAARQRLVQAAVATAEHRLEAEMGHRGHRRRGAQQRVGQLEQRIAPAAQTAVEVLAEPLQRRRVRWATPCHHHV